MATSQTGSKLAVVTGDVVVDWNLALLSSEQDTRVAWNPSGAIRACHQRGGAAMLAGVISEVAKALAKNDGNPWEVVQPAFPAASIKPGAKKYHHSYAMWAPFPYEENPKDGDKQWVWRVKEFLGLDEAREPGIAGQLQDDPLAPGLVVLDDAALGFRDREELWPQSIRDADARNPIVVKMSKPVAEGPLWEHLISRCADRLIAVVSVNDLRCCEVKVSHGLSWESTAQDLFWELVYNPKANALSRCKYVIVSMHTAGTLLLSRHDADADPGQPVVSWDCKLFFDPKVIEDTWGEEHPGYMIGHTTCLVAGIARELMLPEAEGSIERGIQSGTAAMRKLHAEGYGEQEPSLEANLNEPAFPTRMIAVELAKNAEPLAAVTVEDPARFVRRASAEDAHRTRTSSWTILDEVCKAMQQSHEGCEDALRAMARRIVVQDPEDEAKPLAAVPTGRFGALVTADRREIESYRKLRTLIEEYCRQPQMRPLAIGVFGPPGSGKSFGVTQVAKSLTMADVEDCAFNMSQFDDPSGLVAALHQVRDIALSGKIPLVFWDEFDARLAGQDNGWLRYFLAPIQDGEFRDGALTHHVGKAIFVFAGGTSKSMAEFDKGRANKDFRQAKGPDFVSRLSGYVDVMGPNCQDHECPANDAHHLVRRAIVLRSLFERNAPQLFEGGDGKGKLRIDSGVLRAFLFISRYKHGVRSMGAVISMSTLAGNDEFQRSCLPTEDQLDLHVNGRKFLSLVEQPECVGELLERLAVATHQVFSNSVDNYYSSPSAADMSYDELPRDLKEQNQENVRHILAKVDAIGHAVVAARSDDALFDFSREQIERLAEIEHDRWMWQKLANGWRWGAVRDEAQKINEHMLPWEELTEAEMGERYGADADKIGTVALPDDIKKWNRDLVGAIPDILAKAGFTLVKLEDAMEDPE